MRAAALLAARPDGARSALLARVDSNGDHEIVVVPRDMFRGVDPCFAHPRPRGRVELVRSRAGQPVEVVRVAVTPLDVRREAAVWLDSASALDRTIDDDADLLARGFGLAPTDAERLLRANAARYARRPTRAEVRRTVRLAALRDTSFGWFVGLAERLAQQDRANASRCRAMGVS